MGARQLELHAIKRAKDRLRRRLKSRCNTSVLGFVHPLGFAPVRPHLSPHKHGMVERVWPRFWVSGGLGARQPIFIFFSFGDARVGRLIATAPCIRVPMSSTNPLTRAAYANRSAKLIQAASYRHLKCSRRLM